MSKVKTVKEDKPQSKKPRSKSKKLNDENNSEK